MLSLNECFGGRRSCACPDAGRPVDSHSGHRVQGRRRHKIAPQSFSGAMLWQWRSLFEERGYPYGAVAHRVPRPPGATRLEVGDRLLVLRYGCGFLVNFRFVSVKSCRLYCSLMRSVRVAVILLLRFKLYSRCRISSSECHPRVSFVRQQRFSANTLRL